MGSEEIVGAFQDRGDHDLDNNSGINKPKSLGIANINGS